MNLTTLFGYFISQVIFITFLPGGFFALYFAIRGKLVLDHARCCTCDYRLGPSHEDGDACPECGTFLDTPTSIRFDKKTRSLGLFTIAATLIFSSIALPLGIVILTDIYGQPIVPITTNANAPPTYMLPIEQTPNKTYHSPMEFQDLTLAETLAAGNIRPQDLGIWEAINGRVQAEKFSTPELERTLNLISNQLENARNRGPHNAVYRKILSVATAAFEVGVVWLDSQNPKHVATLETLASAIIQPASSVFTVPNKKNRFVPLTLYRLFPDAKIIKSRCTFDDISINTSIWEGVDFISSTTFPTIPSTGEPSTHLIRVTLDVVVDQANTGTEEAQKWPLQLSVEIPVFAAGPGEVLTTYLEPEELPANYLDSFMNMEASAWTNPENNTETILTLTLSAPEDEATAGMIRFKSSVDIPDARLIHGADMNFTFDFGNGWQKIESVNTKTFLIDEPFERSTINVTLEPLMLETETNAIFGKRIRITNLPVRWLNEVASGTASPATAPTVIAEYIGTDTSRKLFGPPPSTSKNEPELEQAMALWLDPQIHLLSKEGKPSVVLSYGSAGPSPASGELQVFADIPGVEIPYLRLRLNSPGDEQDPSDFRTHVTLFTPNSKVEIDQSINLEFVGLTPILRRDETAHYPVFSGRIYMQIPVMVDSKEIAP